MSRRFPVVGSSLVHPVVEVGSEGVAELLLHRGVRRREDERRGVALAPEKLQLRGALLRQLLLEVVD